MRASVSRYALCGVATALLAGCGALVPTELHSPSNSAGEALPRHHTFGYTGGPQTFVVPAGVESITVIALGAAGGQATYRQDTSGLGGRVYAVIPVSAREKLHVFVGGSPSSGFGGFNGGGKPGPFANFGGGGASDVRLGGDKLQDRIVVAGGGGGEGDFEDGGGTGGAGGGFTGGDGATGGFGGYGGGGGAGGSQRHGGSGGPGETCSSYDCGSGQPGESGKLGIGGEGGAGGAGQSSSTYGGSGGGGGGGYYGGGGGGGGSGGEGGSAGGGGGGGSSYVEGIALRVRVWQGWKTATGNGLVVFDWR